MTRYILLAILAVTFASGCSNVPLRSKEFFDEAQIAKIQDELPCKRIQKRDTSVLFFGAGSAPSVHAAIRQLPRESRNVETTERISTFFLLPFISLHTASAEACTREVENTESTRRREQLERARKEFEERDRRRSGPKK